MLVIGNHGDFDGAAAHSIGAWNQAQTVGRQREVHGITGQRGFQRGVISGAGRIGGGLHTGRSKFLAVAQFGKVGHAAIHQRAQRILGRRRPGRLQVLRAVLEVTAAVSEFVVARGGFKLDLSFFGRFTMIGGRIGQRVIARSVVDVGGERILEIVAIKGRFSACILGQQDHTSLVSRICTHIGSQRSRLARDGLLRVARQPRWMGVHRVVHTVDHHASRVDGINRNARVGQSVHCPLVLIHIGGWAFGADACREGTNDPYQVFPSWNAGEIARNLLQGFHGHCRAHIGLEGILLGQKPLQRHSGGLNLKAVVFHALLHDHIHRAKLRIGSGQRGQKRRLGRIGGKPGKRRAQHGRVLGNSLDKAQFFAEQKDADARAGRNGGEIAHDLLVNEGLISHVGVQRIHEQHIDGVVGRDSGNVGEGVGRQRRSGRRRGRAGRPRKGRLKEGDRLRLSILKDLEVLLAQA